MLIGVDTRNNSTLKVTKVWNRGTKKPTKTKNTSEEGRIPWTEEPGGLQSMGSQTVRYD